MPDTEIQAILVKIEEKKKKADELAAEFRRLYRESQEAYTDGDGELAKELSEEGHTAQDQCTAINAEVKELYQDLKKLNAKRRRLSSQATLPPMALKGMPPEYQNVVLETLKSLPAHHVSSELIDRTSYLDKYILGSSGNPVQGNTHFSEINEKATIVLNRQTPAGFVSKDKLKIATAHEVGHVVYRNILTDDQRAEWHLVMDSIYAPLDNPDEDEKVNEDEFARAYSAYQLDDSDWQREFAEEYDFFEESDF